MNAWTMGALLGLAIALNACGGGAPPAEAPKTEATGDVPKKRATLDEGSSPSGAPSADAPTATSTSDDVRRGVAALKAGDGTVARAAFEAALRKNPKQADAHYYFGVVEDKAGDRAAAEKHYKEALALQPDLVEAAENLVAVYLDAQKYDEAAALAKKALEKNPKNPEVQLNYALALGGKGDVAGASKAFDEALKLAPNDARIYLAYAQQLAQWKRKDEALARLKEAARAFGDDAGVIGAVGFELRTLGAVPECIATFDRALALKENADFRTNRALCKYAAKDKAGALADLSAAVAKEPNFAPAHYYLGGRLAEDGKMKEAASEYETYLKLAPSGPMAKQAEERLKVARERAKATK